MTPTEFDFTVTMPGDARLVAAIRQLTAYAAGYAQLTPQTSEQLAEHVERATEAAISASKSNGTAFQYRFTADSAELVIAFSCDAPPPVARPASVAAGEVTIHWSTEGSRHVCRIRQPLESEA